MKIACVVYLGFKKFVLATINKRITKFHKENLGEMLDSLPMPLNQTDLMRRYSTQKKTYRTLVGAWVRNASKIKLKYGTLVRYRPKYAVRCSQIVNVP